MAYEKDPAEIGALWQKDGAKGQYFSGEVNGERIVVFRTKKPEGSKGPDWRILRARPRADYDNTAHAYRAPEEVPDDAIPFAWVLPMILPALGLLGTLG